MNVSELLTMTTSVMTKLLEMKPAKHENWIKSIFTVIVTVLMIFTFFFYSNNISHQKYSWRITLGKIESLTDGKIKSLWSSKCYKVNRKPSRRMGPSINFDVFFEMDKPCDTLLRIFLLKVSLNCKISMQFDDSENCYFFSMLWIQICRISYATLGVYQ